MKPPPFLVSFRSLQEYKLALDAESEALHFDSIEELVRLGVPPVVSVRALACLFGVGARFIGALRRNPQRYYRTFVIRKGKKKREIKAPKVALKLFQKWFGTHLSAAYTAPATVFGFVPGRSAPMAAAVHCGATWVYSVDLSDFFPRTPRARVVQALEALGYPNRGAELAASLCCFGEGLAQGSPASPVLSNLVFANEDASLAALAVALGVRHSRYADDIVFSGQGAVPPDLRTRVHQILAEGNWLINAEKEHLARLPSRLKVHGLLVHGQRPRLTKGYRNRLRAFRHLQKVKKVRPPAP